MAEATIDVGLKVDAQDQRILEAVPTSLKQRWEELNRTLEQTGRVSDTAQARIQRGSEQIFSLAEKVETQGGLTSQQRSAYMRALKETTQVMDREFVERIRVIKNRGAQLALEIDRLFEIQQRAQGQEKTDTIRAIGQKSKELGLIQEKGIDTGAIASTQAARSSLRQLKNELTDIASFVPTVSVAAAAATSAAMAAAVAQAALASQGSTTLTVGPRLQQRAQTSARSAQLLLTAAAASAITPVTGSALHAARTQAGAAQGGPTLTMAKNAAGLWVYPGAARFPGGGAFVGGGSGAAGGFGGGIGGGVGIPGWFGGGGIPAGGQAPAPGGAGAGALALTSALRGLLGVSILGGGAYFAGSFVRRQFSGELERQTRVSDLAQNLQPEGMNYEEFAKRTGKLIPSFSPAESTRFVERFGELTGSQNLLSTRTMSVAGERIRVDRTLGRAEEAATLTRRLGLTPEEGAQQFGTAGQLGLTDQGQERFAKLLATAVVQGQMQGRQGEVFNSLLRMGESVAARTGRALNVGPAASLVARLSATGEPGLRGNMGVSVLERMDAALAGGQVLPQLPPGFLKAMALKSFPDKSLADIDTMMEGGITAFPREMAKIIQSSLQSLGNNDNTRAMLAKTLGIPLGARDKVFEATTRGGSLTDIEKALKDVSDTPAAKVRQSIAELQQEMAGVMGDLIPAYQNLVTEVTKLTQRFEELRDFMRGGFLPDLLKDKNKVEDAISSAIKSALGKSEDTTFDPAVAATDWMLNSSNTVNQWVLDKIKNLLNIISPSEAGASTAPGGVTWSPPARDAALSVGPLSKKDDALSESALRDLSIYGGSVSGLDPALIRSVIHQESRGNPNAVSKKNAQGLMQLLPSSFPQLSDAERFDPTTNVRVGSRYLRHMIDQFGDTQKGIAAYNAGPGAVQKYGGVPPYGETQDYVARVQKDSMRRQGDFLDRTPERKMNVGFAPLTVVVKNEKGDTLSTQTTEVRPVQLPDFNFATAPGGSGMHAPNTSSISGNYR